MVDDLHQLISASSQQPRPLIFVGAELGALVSQFYTLLFDRYSCTDTLYTLQFDRYSCTNTLYTLQFDRYSCTDTLYSLLLDRYSCTDI